MRALSMSQPWAELVMRGVKTVEPRSWRPKETGPQRIAIHASVNIELDKIERLWHDSSNVARVFADQGWGHIADVRALPRGAIIGTVELRGVHSAAAVRAADVDPSRKDWIGDALENAVRDPVTGHLKPGPAPAHALAVAIPATGWVFGFARALAIEPLTDVRGYQHLWEMPADLAADVAAREARSRRGEWRPVAPSREAVRASLAGWRQRFETNEARYAYGLMSAALHEMANDVLTLEDGSAEQMLKGGMRVWKEERGETGADGQLYIRVPRQLKSLFGDAARVPAARFESDLRMLLAELKIAERTNAAYAKVAEAVLALVREELARAEESQSSRAALEASAKQLFKRLWLEAEEELERMDRVLHIPEY